MTTLRLLTRRVCLLILLSIPTSVLCQDLVTNKGTGLWGIRVGPQLAFPNGAVWRLNTGSDSIGGVHGFSKGTGSGWLAEAALEWYTYGDFGLGLTVGYTATTINFDEVVSTSGNQSVRESLRLELDALVTAFNFSFHFADIGILNVGPALSIRTRSLLRVSRAAGDSTVETESDGDNWRLPHIGMRAGIKGVPLVRFGDGYGAGLGLSIQYGQDWFDRAPVGSRIERLGILYLGATVEIGYQYPSE